MQIVETVYEYILFHFSNNHDNMLEFQNCCQTNKCEKKKYRIPQHLLIIAPILKYLLVDFLKTVSLTSNPANK